MITAIARVYMIACMSFAPLFTIGFLTGKIEFKEDR